MVGLVPDARKGPPGELAMENQAFESRVLAVAALAHGRPGSAGSLRRGAALAAPMTWEDAG